MNINFTRDSVNKNRFHLDGIREIGEKKSKTGIAGYRGIIGWISAYILHKTVPVKSNKGVYYLNCKSLEHWKQRIVVGPEVETQRVNFHNKKDVEWMLQNIKATRTSSNEVEQPESYTQIEGEREDRIKPEQQLTTKNKKPSKIKHKILKSNKTETEAQTQVKETLSSTTSVVEKGPSKQINIVQVFRSCFLGLDDFKALEKNIERIAKSIKEYDQDDLNHELLSFYKDTKSLLPMKKLNKEYKENSKRVELGMMIKALEYIEDNRKTLLSEESPEINQLIKDYEGKYQEQELPIVVTLKTILQEGKALGKADIKELSVKIRNILEQEWQFNSSELNQAVTEYVINVEDVEPLINLTIFTINNDKTKADRMIAALQDVESKTWLSDAKKINRISEYLQQIGQSKVRAETKPEVKEIKIESPPEVKIKPEEIKVDNPKVDKPVVKVETKPEPLLTPPDIEPKTILMTATLKPELKKSFNPNYVELNSEQILTLVNADSDKYSQNSLNGFIGRFIANTEDVTPLIKLFKHYESTKEAQKGMRLENAIKSNWKIIEPSKQKKLQENLPWAANL